MTTTAPDTDPTSPPDTSRLAPSTYAVSGSMPLSCWSGPGAVSSGSTLASAATWTSRNSPNSATPVAPRASRSA